MEEYHITNNRKQKGIFCVEGERYQLEVSDGCPCKYIFMHINCMASAEFVFFLHL